MNKRFFYFFKDSIIDFLSSKIVVPALGFLLFALVFSFIGKKFAVFQSSWANVVWTSVFFLIFVFVGAFFLGSMISIANDKKNSLRNAFSEGKRNCWHNFFALVMFSILYWLAIGILYLVTKFSLMIQPSVVLSIIQFKLLTFFVLIVYLLIFFIFFSFTNVFITLNNTTIISGVRKSFLFVKNNYLVALSLNVAFFVLYYLIEKLPKYFSEIVEYLIWLPFFVIIITKIARK